MRLPLLLLALSTAALSQAGVILGIDDAGIYRIDVATGTSTLAVSVIGFGSGDTNALAYNAATNVAYFQRNGKLWSANLTNGAVAATAYSVGAADAATFYRGAYYYSSGADVRKIDFVAPTSTAVYTFSPAKGFGDIATDANGKLYGSSGSGTFTLNLANNAYANLPATGKQLQLGFVGTTLYGVANGNAGSPSGTLYTINTVTGAQTATGVIAKYNGAALAIRDAATVQAVPEPATVAALALGALGALRRRKRA